MLSIFKKMDRFNAWYNKQREPYRFIFFMVLMSVWLFPLTLGSSFHSKPAVFFGLAGLALTVVLALSRVEFFRRFRR